MTTEELEAILEAGAESQGLDFKADCPWHPTRFAKDILAFSNLPDGGRIVIGVEDGTFRRQGLSAANKATFVIDQMRDQITTFADPHVNFGVEFAVDRNRIEVAIMRIQSFDDIPVICRRDSEHTKAGVLYYRNRNRRVESAPISNSADMREVVELAAVRAARRWARLGVVQPQPDPIEARLRDELRGL